MRNASKDILRFLALAWAVMSVTLPAAGQSVASRQTLDRVFTYDTTSVLNMAFGNAYRPPDFTSLGVSGTNFVSCTLTAIGGLYCLDGRVVRNWRDPMLPAVYTDPVSCADPAFGFDTRRGDPCTAMTVDESGVIWLAAKKRNAHSVIKVIAKVSACPDATWVTLAGGIRCAKEVYSGRPALVDLVAIDSDSAKNFRACSGCAIQSGVLGIEERKNAVFFPDPQVPQAITVMSSKDWGLTGGELLQDISFLQLPGSVYPVETTILATTTTGRILARSTTVAGAARTVFNIPAERRSGSAVCNVLPQQYGLRTSPTTGIAYVSDRNYCQVLALEPNGPALTTLVNIAEGAGDLTLSTVVSPVPPPGYATYFGIIGLTIAPGISINLTDCRINCAIVNSPDGDPAAELTNLQLAAGSSTGATIFQIKDIPDCRYAGEPTFPLAKRAVCDAAANAVIDPQGNAVDVLPSGALGSLYPPAAMRLNVTPLLPAVVINAFNASGLSTGGLPPLLISRQYRAQSRTQFVFEALFALPQPNVRFVNTFEGEFQVPELEGTASSLGCTEGSGNLLAWDVVTYVSEIFTSVGGRHIDTLANIDCGSIRIGATRLSLLPYDLQINPDTWGPTLNSTTPVAVSGNDAVFARLMQSLYSDLGYVQQEQACKAIDPVPNGGAAPIANNICNGLTSTWANGQIKLDKCIDAAFQPKSSASNENCQSFVSQLTNYRSSLPATTAPQDVGNRLGELKVRIAVLFHLYYTRFLPSIPAAGFCREAAVPGCASPWT